MQDRASSIPPTAPPGAHDLVVSLGADGIIDIDFHRCEHVTLEILEAANARHVALCPDRKLPVLMRGDHVSGADYAAQRFASSPPVCRVVAALALVVTSFLERHLARLFLMYHHPPYPTRVFEDEAVARAWLRGFLETK